MAKEITNRADDYSKWYNDIVKKAGLAENSAVKGCMVIKPYGYAIWENIQRQLDHMFKETGHQNAYFPLLVPKSLFEAEEKNAEGFAKECAVVTHYRLENDPNEKGKLRVAPDAKLEEELIIRPTSEAIIWNTYKNWIQSYRDLPLLINQWANVMRWEMRTRPFIRTAEFLWQEGHTAHATKDEAVTEAKLMHDVYATFAEEWMAMPVIKGYKSENERFAGADDTYTIEALMQDGKALQAGTSHFLGQNFAKAFDVTYMTSDNKDEYVWATSWGVSTRLIEVARRDTKEKNSVALDGIEDHITQLLDDIQNNLLQKAKDFRTERTTVVDTFDEFKTAIEDVGGFVSAHWDGTVETELKIKEETKATLRCIPLDAAEEDGVCVYSGKPSRKRVLFAKAY